MRIEQVTGVDDDQVIVLARCQRHAGDDTDAETDLDVGLDRVGVRRSERDVELQTGALEQRRQ